MTKSGLYKNGHLIIDLPIDTKLTNSRGVRIEKITIIAQDLTKPCSEKIDVAGLTKTTLRMSEAWAWAPAEGRTDRDPVYTREVYTVYGGTPWERPLEIGLWDGEFDIDLGGKEEIIPVDGCKVIDGVDGISSADRGELGGYILGGMFKFYCNRG